MLFQSVPAPHLARMCRSLSTMLSSGIPVGKAITLAGNKSTHPASKAVLSAVSEAVAEGDSLAEGFGREADRLPDLFIEMIGVAEESGALPEILLSLAETYENGVRLRRRFIQSITWPVLQYVLAVLIIAGMITIIGWLSQSGFDPLGFGLTGGAGALLWIGLNFGTVALLLGGLWVIRRSVAGRKSLDPLVMKIPVVGGCLRDFAIARFSWAYALTQQTGMSVLRSVELGLRATDNGHYLNQTATINGLLREGEELSVALNMADGFPEEYIAGVSIAEDSGTVPEHLERISPELEARANRSLEALVGVASWAVRLATMGFIAFLIFRLAFWYVGMFNDALNSIEP